MLLNFKRSSLPALGVTTLIMLALFSSVPAAPLFGQTESGSAGAVEGVEGAETTVAPEAQTSDSQPGDMKLTTRFSFYNHGDSGDGNPFLDEALTVVEPVFIFDHTVTDTFAYSSTSTTTTSRARQSTA